MKSIAKSVAPWLAIMAAASVSALIWPSHLLESPLLTPIEYLERVGYDTQFYRRGPDPSGIDSRIHVVGYDEATESALNSPWPPSRKLQAKVIENLLKDGARLVVMDVFFFGPTTTEADRALDVALSKSDRVVLGARISRDRVNKSKQLQGPYYNDDLGIDFERKAMIGLTEVPVDEDGIVRAAVLGMTFQDEFTPSLGLAAYMKLQGINAIPKLKEGYIELGDSHFPYTERTEPDPVDGTRSPVTWIDYPAGAAAFRSDISFYQVADDKFPPGSFRNAIVFVGIAGRLLARENGDLFTMAYTRLRPESLGGSRDPQVPGVYVQAHSLNALIKSRFMKPVLPWIRWVAAFALCFIAVFAIRKMPNWRGPIAVVAAVLAYDLSSIILFDHGRFLPWVAPNTFGIMLGAASAWVEFGTLRRRWSGFVSPAVFDQIAKEGGAVIAKRFEATVVFGDIRGFTSFSEKHEPEKVLRLLNTHLERFTDAIFEEKGTIDKFLGDGILAVFGAPVPIENAALRAVRAAWKMRELSMQPVRDISGEPYVLASGFGVATGPFVAGLVGSRRRHDYSVIGDVVNLSARLQGVTGESDVIIDEATFLQIEREVQVEPLGEVTLKGKAQPVACYKVVGWIDADSATKSAIQPKE